MELCCERPLEENARRPVSLGRHQREALGSDELRMEGSGCSVKAVAHFGRTCVKMASGMLDGGRVHEAGRGGEEGWLCESEAWGSR